MRESYIKLRKTIKENAPVVQFGQFNSIFQRLRLFIPPFRGEDPGSNPGGGTTPLLRCACELFSKMHLYPLVTEKPMKGKEIVIHGISQACVQEHNAYAQSCMHKTQTFQPNVFFSREHYFLHLGQEKKLYISTRALFNI